MKKKILVPLLIASFLSPAAYSQTFGDVSENYWAFDFIEEIAQRAITTGCGGGNYCPDATVTRAQMAVFLVRVFGQLTQDFVSVPGSVVRPSNSSDSVALLADATIVAAQTGSRFNLGAVQLPRTRATPANERGEAAATRRQRDLTWAQRLKRVFAIDIDKSAGLPICTTEGRREAVGHRDVPDETCLQCGGRLRLIASVEQPAVIDRILEHLGRDAASVDPAHPSRAPPERPRLI